MIAAGIDVGSRTVKVVLVRRGTRRPLAGVVCDQGVEQDRIISRAFGQALRQAGITRKKLAGVVATGWGRTAVGFADETETEISCVARGIRAEAPEIRTVIDIGGQDCKVIWLDPHGRVVDFVMNDRCAAGTGRFLELVATRLGTGLASLGRLAVSSPRARPITSTCAVFADTEIIGLLAGGIDPAGIAAGVLASVTERIASLAGRRPLEKTALAGGVALIPGMRGSLESRLGREIILPRSPQLVGALGAALHLLGPEHPKTGVLGRTRARREHVAG